MSVRFLTTGRTSMVLAATVLCATAGLASTALAVDSTTARMPTFRKHAGVLMSDLTNRRVLLLRDIDGDGSAAGPGETTIFFQGSTTTVPPTSTQSVFSLHQAEDGTVYVGDLGSKTVYWVRDNNLNGVIDSNESGVYFSEALNNSLLFLPTPTGLAGDASGLFLTNAGVSATPLDGIIRLVDLSAPPDRNCDGALESFYILDSNVNISTVSAPTPSNPFDVVSIGSVLYYTDFRTSATGGRALLRAPYSPTTTSIPGTDLGVFIDAANTFGVQLAQGLATDGQSLYTISDSRNDVQVVSKLRDLNGSNTIDQANEVQQVWTDLAMPVGETLGTSQSLDVGSGRLTISSFGSSGGQFFAGVVLARDLNNNGSFADPGETGWFLKNGQSTLLPAGSNTVRRVMFYGWPCPADYDQNGTVAVPDIFAFLSGWFSGDIRADIDGGGLAVGDIFAFLGRWFAGC